MLRSIKSKRISGYLIGFLKPTRNTHKGSTEFGSGVPNTIRLRVLLVGSGKISNPNITSRPTVLLILAIDSIQSKFLKLLASWSSFEIIDGNWGNWNNSRYFRGACKPMESISAVIFPNHDLMTKLTSIGDRRSFVINIHENSHNYTRIPYSDYHTISTKNSFVIRKLLN